MRAQAAGLAANGTFSVMNMVLSVDQDALTARQRSELDYHAQYAARHAELIGTPIDLAVCSPGERRPWNAYWSLYDVLMSYAPMLRGKRVLVPGCGFGEDCVRIAHLGAEVHGTDLSPDVIKIAAQRVVDSERPITFSVMPCEKLDYPDASFDAVVLVNILHHVDTPRTMTEVRRVAKDGALIVGLEMYTHSAAQRLRTFGLVEKLLYPRLRSAIYGTDTPYITPDERKIDEKELALIVQDLKGLRLAYHNIFCERLFSAEKVGAARADDMLCKLMGNTARYAAGRVIFSGLLDRR